MTFLDVSSVVLMILVIVGSAALIVLAGVVLVRSRRPGHARFFGRVVHRPRLWASAAVCCGLAGLLFEAREFMPSSWQRPSLNILGVLFLTYLVLLFTHLFMQSRANRAGAGEPQARS